MDDVFQASLFEELEPRYDIRPTQTVPIVRQFGDEREWITARWGLLPGWVKDPKKFTTLFNARSEGLAEKPSFRSAYKKRRCLVPASGFYEWKGEKGAKQRHYIGLKDRTPLALAGQ